MIKQTIVWTLLPDPEASPPAGTAHLSLVFSIRLFNEPPEADVKRLSDYPAIAAWPEFPYQLHVEIKGRDGQSVTRQATPIDSPPNAALWQALFAPASTLVQPFRFDAAAASSPIQSYPSQSVAESLCTKYVELFAPVNGILNDGLVAPEDGPPTSPDEWTAVDRLLRTVSPRTAFHLGADPVDELLREGVVPDEFSADPAGWDRLADFHRQVDPATEQPAAGQPQPARDFHGVLAALADHPGLMARIGLVRRVGIELPPGLTGPVTIRAIPIGTPLVQNYRPRTACVLLGGQLVLAGHDMTEGAHFLPLDNAATYSPLDVDIDAGGLALLSYANMLRNLPRHDPPPTLRAPTLRSDGIFVAQKDRQVTFRELLKTAAFIDRDLACNHEGEAITMTADNVQQGYRVDVFDKGSNRWFPLCRRVGSYTVQGYRCTVPINDEGTVTDALARLKQPDGTPISRLHQSLFRWSGWSLVAEQPGKMLGLGEQPQDPAPMLDPTLPFSCVVKPPDESLPSLRFGRTYRFRARLVDIAGRSLPFNPQPTPGEPATAALYYSRYEPVPAPVLVPRRAISAGESVTVLVVRTDNRNPSAPVQGPTCERHLLPPKAAVLLLERHGVLDVATEHRLDPQVYTLLTKRDSGMVTGNRDPHSGGAPFVDVDKMELPWLPDPLSRGIALHGLPGVAGIRAEWPRGTAWHQQFPLRLVVQQGRGEGTPSVVVDAAARTVRVTLAPGAALPMSVSSVLNAGDEGLLGLWRWFADSGSAAGEIAARRADALAGRIGQLTPLTELRLIHAVRCPVTPPTFGQGMQVVRQPSETGYVLEDPAMAIHQVSTVSVHIEASWNELVDDISQLALTRSSGRAVLRQDEKDIRPAPTSGASTATTPFRVRHDLGDTKHRVVQYTPVGTSRFVSYFTERRTMRLNGTTPVAVAAGVNPVPGTVVVRADVPLVTDAGTPAEPGRTYSPERDFTFRVDDGTGTITRTGPASAIPDGASVEVSYVAPPVTLAGPPVTLHVPATVRPPAPVVHEVVPAFGWDQSQSDGTLISTRHGGCIRVYLGRPWYVSGEGELLAVMVLGESAQPDAAAERWATMWGRDPIRAAGAAPQAAYPRPSDLLGADPQSPEHAMGYPVEYDDARKLWYSDVRFNFQRVYEPFVRLRVARLQPYALRVPVDLRLSSVVDAGFVKIPALRRTRVVIEGASAAVTVTGPRAPDSADNLASELTAHVQVRSQTVTDVIGWQTMDTFPPVPLVLDETVAGPIARWKGTIRLPPEVGTRPMRVVVQEYERLRGPTPEQTTGRISYLDTLEF
ncbi:hypothetical protein [Actinopolymorpha pittospori]